MKLRDHPLMSYRGVHTWPPIWTFARGSENNKPQGEIGTLIRTRRGAGVSFNRFYVWMEYESGTYVGVCLFDDPSFCAHVFELFQRHHGCPIDYIARLDVSSTL